MSSAQDTPPPDPPRLGPGNKGKSEPKGAKGDRAFDAWLKQGLHKLYDDVAGEPIPEALLKLIREDREK
jgi:hypothetical protein